MVAMNNNDDSLDTNDTIRQHIFSEEAFAAILIRHYCRALDELERINANSSVENENVKLDEPSRSLNKKLCELSKVIFKNPCLLSVDHKYINGRVDNEIDESIARIIRHMGYGELLSKSIYELLHPSTTVTAYTGSFCGIDSLSELTQIEFNFSDSGYSYRIILKDWADIWKDDCFHFYKLTLDRYTPGENPFLKEGDDFGDEGILRLSIAILRLLGPSPYSDQDSVVSSVNINVIGKNTHLSFWPKFSSEIFDRYAEIINDYADSNIASIINELRFRIWYVFDNKWNPHSNLFSIRTSKLDIRSVIKIEWDKKDFLKLFSTLILEPLDYKELVSQDKMDSKSAIILTKIIYDARRHEFSRMVSEYLPRYLGVRVPSGKKTHGFSIRSFRIFSNTVSGRYLSNLFEKRIIEALDREKFTIGDFINLGDYHCGYQQYRIKKAAGSGKVVFLNNDGQK
jgi:hypothetical protein